MIELDSYMQSLMRGDHDNNDYMGSDGLMRCGKCDTPTQYVIDKPGTPYHGRVVPANCACREERYLAGKAREKNEEFKRRVQVNKRVGFPSDAYKEWTFDADDMKRPDISAHVRSYAESFTSKTPTWLLLHGPMGTGKTFYTACVANYLLDKGYEAVLTNVKRISNIVNSTWDNRQVELDKILNCDLLILDDLGTERRTEYMAEQVFDIIDGRYKIGKPMIISTNTSYGQMLEEEDPQWGRIYSRIIEKSFPLDVSGEDRRKVGKR